MQQDDNKSGSPSCTNTGGFPEPSSRQQTGRRVTIFERAEIIEELSTTMMIAIQREIVELQAEHEKKILEAEHRSDNRVAQILRLAASERLDLERLRIESSNSWEKGTGTSGECPPDGGGSNVP